MRARLAGQETRRSLAGDWAMVVSSANAYATPADIPANARSIPAPVPGTVAEALEKAGKFDRTDPTPLDDRDFWYVAAIEGEPAGPARLMFDGLATIAEVYLNGEKILK